MGRCARAIGLFNHPGYSQAAANRFVATYEALLQRFEADHGAAVPGTGTQSLNCISLSALRSAQAQEPVSSTVIVRRPQNVTLRVRQTRDSSAQIRFALAKMFCRLQGPMPTSCGLSGRICSSEGGGERESADAVAAGAQVLRHACLLSRPTGATSCLHQTDVVSRAEL